MFSHGQLYVVMSRATARTNIKVLALPPDVEAVEEEANKKATKKAQKNAKKIHQIKKLRIRRPK